MPVSFRLRLRERVFAPDRRQAPVAARRRCRPARVPPAPAPGPARLQVRPPPPPVPAPTIFRPPRQPARGHRDRDRRPAVPRRRGVPPGRCRASSGPRHQRSALGETRVVPRRAEPAFGHRRLDLGAPGRERLDRLARDPGDLEAAVGMGLLDAVAKARQRCGKLRAVEGAEQHLRAVELLVGHRAPLVVPLAVGALHHVGQHGMGVKLRIEIARGVVAEGGGHDLLSARADHLSRYGILHAGLGDVLLDPAEGRLDRPVVRLDDAAVAADQGRDGDGLSGRRR